MKRTYELMVVVKPDVEVTEKTATDLVKKMVGDEATVGGVSLLGKKQLAYPLKKYTEGQYVLARLEGKGIHVHEIEKKVQLGSEVLRYLLSATN